MQSMLFWKMRDSWRKQLKGCPKMFCSLVWKRGVAVPLAI